VFFETGVPGGLCGLRRHGLKQPTIAPGEVDGLSGAEHLAKNRRNLSKVLIRDE
jgi:hypothetical protein